MMRFLRLFLRGHCAQGGYCPLTFSGCPGPRIALVGGTPGPPLSSCRSRTASNFWDDWLTGGPCVLQQEGMSWYFVTRSRYHLIPSAESSPPRPHSGVLCLIPHSDSDFVLGGNPATNSIPRTENCRL